MKDRYANPRELIEALQHHGDGARTQLTDLLHSPLKRLMSECALRHHLSQPVDRLTLHALHSAETWLRTRSSRPFVGMTWTAFRAAVLLHLAKLALHPFGKEGEPLGGPGPLPESQAYHSETYFLPQDRVGNYWFGGDWFAGLHGADGSFWVIVADVTGHGYYAYLLASTLPGVWRSCWEKLAPLAQPADLLNAMHALLADCLPEGVYVESTLVRLSPLGEVTVAPAGGSRLLLRRGGSIRADLHKLRGTWLGLSAPSTNDQRTWVLGAGDELLIGTDGMFDHLTEHGGVGLWDQFDHKPEDATLLDAVRRLLGQALQQTPQRDDITMVLLRRRVPIADREQMPTGANPS